ncbi:MAG: hypothetical protein IKO41_17795 [Lachnospiraceae bacterium]|nr:hypothetical protein [Lachnospiraceae bacterium]
MCGSAEEMRQLFVRNGWGPEVSFTEATEESVSGILTAQNAIREGKKFFICNQTGNLYDARGNLHCFGKLRGFVKH